MEKMFRNFHVLPCESSPKDLGHSWEQKAPDASSN